MRFFMLLVGAASVLAQPSVTLHPSVITDCNPYQLGATTVEWHAPGAAGLVQVLVASVQASFTGHVPPDGRSTTGVWVNDGMPFVLVDAAGNTLASTTAHVVCDAEGGPVGAGLASSSYFPLEIGNRWIYKTLSRLGPTTYAIRTVTGSQTIAGQLWFVLQGGLADAQTAIPQGQQLMREDAGGRIYIYQNGQAVLWLDPTANPDPGAQLKITGRGQFQNELGAFADAISYNRSQTLSVETGTFIRGIGQLFSTSTMLTGSSGGFLDSAELVEARIDSNLVFRPPASSVEVTMEAAGFDVTHGVVTNCILPCYFAACGLGGGQPDPPGTYKPCFRAGARLSVAAGPASVVLDVLDTSGNVLATAPMTLVPDDSGRAEGFHQMPLYSAPNQPFAPGNYQLRATGAGAAAVIGFQIQ